MIELLEIAPATTGQHSLRAALVAIDRRVTREPHRVGGAQLTPAEEAQADAKAEARADQVAMSAPELHPNMVPALKLITPRVALALIYALIGETAHVVVMNPEVREARSAALVIVDQIVRAGRFPRAYLLKHLRNVIVQATGRTPEQVISNASHGDTSALVAAGVDALGDLGNTPPPSKFTQTASDISSLLNAFGAVVSAVRPPKPPVYNYPATPAQVNPYANQPAPRNPGGLSTPVLAAMVGGGVLLVGVFALALRK